MAPAGAVADAVREFFRGDNVETLLTLMGRVLPQIVVEPVVACHMVKNSVVNL